MKILIINSDSPNNRGDRAILVGGIKLIKLCFPESEIWSLSEKPERDKEWFGINFLPMAVHTTNPLKLLRLGLFARTCDIVFWGGGELLKDYTNRLGLVYWVVKMLIVRIFNEEIYGFYQGIGPTSSLFSRALILFIVNQMKQFFVRDAESSKKLSNWGVKTRIISSFDPAILCCSKPLNTEEFEQLSKDSNITDDFISNAIGIGARNWFHYKTNSWIPFRITRKFGFRKYYNSLEVQQYKLNLAELCDGLIEMHNANIIFFPMHTSSSEDDGGFSREVKELMKNKNRVRIIEKDSLSPQSFHNAIGACRAFIGFRLHSFILATAAYVPSVVFYYVDKGRVFGNQLDASSYCWPIENILDKASLHKSQELINKLIRNRKEESDKLIVKLNGMRKELTEEFVKNFRNFRR